MKMCLLCDTGSAVTEAILPVGLALAVVVPVEVCSRLAKLRINKQKP